MRQQQEQITVLQVLLEGSEEEVVVEGSTVESNIEIAKLLVFNKEVGREGQEGLSQYAGYT